MKWTKINKDNPSIDTRGFIEGRIVYLTANKKLMILTDPSPWHFEKYNITHYLIVPKYGTK